MPESDQPSGITLERIQELAHQTAIEKGWWDNERNFAELLMLCVTELAEATEGWRQGYSLNELYLIHDKPEGIPAELADLIIRVADLAQGFGINLTKAVLAKLEYNKTRTYRHGDKRA